MVFEITYPKGIPNIKDFVSVRIVLQITECIPIIVVDQPS
jgi:hypothetical protein